MTEVKEKAVTLIQNMSDEKVSYVLDIINSITGLTSSADNEKDIAQRHQALANLQKFRGRLPQNTDYKKELTLLQRKRY